MDFFRGPLTPTMGRRHQRIGENQGKVTFHKRQGSLTPGVIVIIIFSLELIATEK